MTAPSSDLTGYDSIISTYLNQWGLSDLISVVNNLGKTGASSDQINLTLQGTPEWQARFAGNQQRVAQGLAPLDPASYIALESQYDQLMRSYNLPPGFYDSKEQTDSWIGGNVSANELSDRLQMANTAYLSAPDESRQAWDQFYGNTHGVGGAVSAILDPHTAESVIQQQVATAGIGGAALGQGLHANQAVALKAAQQGVSLDSARAAYRDIATRLPTDQSIAGRFGANFGQTQEENATLLGQGDALRQQQTLYSEEQSQFAGHGGANAASGNPGSNY